MESPEDLLERAKIHDFMDYIGLGRKIEEGLASGTLRQGNYKRIRIALLSNSTLSGIRETLLVKCLGQGILPEFYSAPYNQYNQEILDQKSGLYAFQPDLVILILDTLSVSGDRYFQLGEAEGDLRQWVESTVSSLASLVSILEERAPKAKVLFHNFEVPAFSPLGIIENKQGYTFRESVRGINTGLSEHLRNDPRAFLFDYDLFSSRVGKDNAVDYKLYYLGDIRINPRVVPALCDAYIPYIRALLSMSKKCLVLDLDGVLWGGVVGEDGLEGIKLGPTPEGQPFVDFQKHILSLFNRGVILAVNSANNPDDALEVFRKHPYMVLKEEHFAAMLINWDNKVANMKAIAEQIEIGVDSLVFIDDTPMHREVVRKALPEVMTVELPPDPALYPKAIANLRVFDTLQLTSEDRVRGKMYAEQRKRQEFQKSSSDITEYLKALQTVVTIERANKFSIPRIAQLTQKTNQFNVTTRRYLEDDIARMAAAPNYLVASVKVEDKFGDSGLTGVAIVEKRGEKWRIDTFLLSCRVLGRKVEETLLSFIVEQAASEGARALIGEFIPTKKNLPAKDFFSGHGFERVGDNQGAELWEYNLGKRNDFPMYVKVVVR